MIPALGKRDRNRNKLLPTEAPPTKKNKTTHSTIPAPSTSAWVQTQIVPEISRGNPNSSSFSWNSTANTTPTGGTPDNNYGQLQTSAEHPLPLNPIHSTEVPSSAQSPAVTGLNHTPFSLKTSPTDSDIHPGGVCPSSNLQAPDTPTRMDANSNPSLPNTDAPRVEIDPLFGQPLKSSTSTDQDLPASPTLPRSSCSQDISHTPDASALIQDAQAQATPRLKRRQLNNSSFSWDHNPPAPTDSIFQPAPTQTSITPGIACKGHKSPSFSWDTTVDKTIADEDVFPTNHDDPVPVTTSKSSTQDASDPDHGIDAMEVEQLPRALSVASLDYGSFCWDHVPLARDPGGDMQSGKNDISQSFHPRPPSPPQDFLPPDPAADAMDVEQLPATQPLANLNSGSFYWDGVSPTHNTRGNV